MLRDHAKEGSESMMMMTFMMTFEPKSAYISYTWECTCFKCKNQE